MKKPHGIRGLALLLLIVSLVAALSGCAKSEVQSTISTFEAACQDLDVRGAVSCLDPKVSSPILSAMDLLGIEDTSGLLNTLVDTLGVYDPSQGEAEAFIRSIRITPQSYTFNGDKDECTVSAQLSYGEDESDTITLQMILSDGTWYIAGISD
jgi:hypothetical protein